GPPRGRAPASTGRRTGGCRAPTPPSRHRRRCSRRTPAPSSPMLAAAMTRVQPSAAGVRLRAAVAVGLDDELVLGDRLRSDVARQGLGFPGELEEARIRGVKRGLLGFDAL